MIDTVVVFFTIQLSTNQLADWDFKPIIKADGTVWGKWYKKVALHKNTVITLTYYPPNPMCGPHGNQQTKLMFQEPMLRVEVSLPKVLWDNNVLMLLQEHEIEQAVDILNAFFKNKTWIPPIHFEQGNLWRLDLVYNHDVGILVKDYINAGYRLIVPRRLSFPYPHGVQFKSEKKRPLLVTVLYDKEAESHLAFAWGLLRQETSLRSQNYIQDRIGFQTLGDITLPLITTVLEKELVTLHVDKQVISTRDYALETLRRKYTRAIARRLFEYLAERQTKTVEQMILEGKGRQSIRRDNEMITDAGVSLALTDGKVILPPLSIDWDYAKKWRFTLSDT